MISIFKNPSTTNGREDEQSDLPKFYEVETIGEDEETTFFRFWNPH